MSGRTALAGAAATVLLVGAVASGDTPGADADVIPWRVLPDPPLSPREFPTGFWTGNEVVLVGGSDAPPCPPSALCRPPTPPPLSDGAAYDPAAGTWRSIGNAPVAFSWAQPVVVGATAYLWIEGEPARPQAPSAFLAYRAEEDKWDELPLPTDEPGAYRLVEAGDRLVAHSWGDEPRELPDFVLDPAAETWSELPDDPLSPGFDRVMRWSGQELLLFDHELVANPPGDLPLRGAALDLASGEWRVLADPDAALGGSGWVSHDDLLNAGWVDGARADYRLRSGLVADRATGAQLRMPELEALEHADGGTTEVTAGTDLFVFLGSEWSDPDGRLHSQAWLWSPRP